MLMLIGGIGIGFAPIFVRLSEVGPVTSAFWRFALAAPVFMLAALYMRGKNTQARAINPKDARTLLICGLFLAVDMGLWHLSITMTSVANATLLANLNVVFVAVIGFLFLGHALTRMFLIGLALALSGTLALMGSSLEFGGSRIEGDLIGVATAAMYTGYFLTAAALRQHFSTRVVLSWTTAISALALLPAALMMGEVFWPVSMNGWIVLLALALISQVAGQGLIVYSLAHLPPAFVALALLIQPVVAALAAWTLFGEALGALELAGAVLVLSGIVLARRGTG